MGLLNIIRRMHLRQKLSIREIARLTGVSRNTVTKHLAANTIEPKFATPERQSKIDPFAEKLAGWLKTEAGKSRKERRTAKRLHADLVTLGFTGSYARVAAFARRWRADRQREQQTTGRGTFVPLHFDPGDAFQFDWSEDFAVLGGERTKLAGWRISSCRTAGPFCFVLTLCKPMRCCSTPIGTASVSLAASLAEASRII
jgi:DNA-binding transcriptional ArsR family regulator